MCHWWYLSQLGAGEAARHAVTAPTLQPFLHHGAQSQQQWPAANSVHAWWRCCPSWHAVLCYAVPHCCWLRHDRLELFVIQVTGPVQQPQQQQHRAVMFSTVIVMHSTSNGFFSLDSLAQTSAAVARAMSACRLLPAVTSDMVAQQGCAHFLRQ